MIRFLFILLILIKYQSNANSADWIIDGIATLTLVKEVSLPDGSIYSIHTADATSTSNTGNFELTNCAGDRLVKEGKMIETNFYCEVEVSDGNKYYIMQKRSKTDADAGVGKQVIIGGTNIYNKLSGTVCTYAVSFYKNRVFLKTICKIPDEIFSQLKKN